MIEGNGSEKKIHYKRHKLVQTKENKTKKQSKETISKAVKETCQLTYKGKHQNSIVYLISIPKVQEITEQYCFKP